MAYCRFSAAIVLLYKGISLLSNSYLRKEAEILCYNILCRENVCLPSKPICLFEAMTSTTRSGEGKKRARSAKMSNYQGICP